MFYSYRSVTQLLAVGGKLDVGLSTPVTLQISEDEVRFYGSTC